MSMFTQLCIMLYTNFVCGVKAFKEEEKGAVDIVAIVVMIGVAVLLAVVFKDGIATMLRKLFTTITGQANSAVTSAA